MSNWNFTSTTQRSRIAMPIGGVFLTGDRDRTAACGFAALPGLGKGTSLLAVTGVVGPYHAWSPPN